MYDRQVKHFVHVRGDSRIRPRVRLFVCKLGEMTIANKELLDHGAHSMGKDQKQCVVVWAVAINSRETDWPVGLKATRPSQLKKVRM